MRGENEIYHFLLPDPGMADYSSGKKSVANQLYPDDFERLKSWRKDFTQPLEEHEVKRLRQLSTAIDALWAEHAKLMAEDRQKTEDPLAIWPAKETEQTRLSRAEKEEIRTKHLLNQDDDLATPYRRLKLVMDYWCALWFWPITQSASLPSREQWWMEIGAILEGNIVEVALQKEMSLDAPATPVASGEKNQPHLLDVPGNAELFPSSLIPQPSSLRLHDRYGQLRISRLRQNFPRIVTVEKSAARHRFFHWELSFADIFASRGGFDLILGNPPWLKIEWNEAGILGEVNPLFAIRKLNATEISKLRTEAFAQFKGLQESWMEELEEAEATQNFLNALQNYPVLKGMQTNLYKCFLPLGWRLNSPNGNAGFLHPEGPYDDPKGGGLRQVIYPKLRSHFQFVNEAHLFSEVHNMTKYSVNIYGPEQTEVNFNNIANLFTPTTVDSCFTHDGHGEVGGYKTASGEWNMSGHADRIVRVDEAQLRVFSQLYDEAGTPPLRARLPALHAATLSSILKKLASYPHRLSDLGGDYFSTVMFDETNAHVAGTIIRNKDRSAPFASSADDWIVSGPHFFVSNPLNKTPRRICAGNKQYDLIDLESIPDDYLPRTNYRPMLDRKEYLQCIPRVTWIEPGELDRKRSTDYYRLSLRKMLPISNERTLTGAIIPKGVAHIHGCYSIAFKSNYMAARFSVVSTSIIADFLTRSTGRSNINGIPEMIPFVTSSSF
ncbi:MAG: hypothetical protein WCH40_09765 [Verrucomicrobiales bacterium]